MKPPPSLMSVELPQKVVSVMAAVPPFQSPPPVRPRLFASVQRVSVIWPWLLIVPTDRDRGFRFRVGSIPTATPPDGLYIPPELIRPKLSLMLLLETVSEPA